jgi:hypothetical protein
MEFIKGLFKGIGLGLLGAPALYVLGFLFETLACFCPTCSRCADYNEANCLLGSFWSGAFFGKAFVFLLIAGTVVGFIYGVVKELQEHDVGDKIQRKNAQNAKDKRNRESGIYTASTSVKNLKDKSDNILVSIKKAKETIVSLKAKELIDEADTMANSSDRALENAVKNVENANRKSSNGALKTAQQTERTSKLLEKDVDAANDLYKQAIKEEQDWNRLQLEANDAVNKAQKAATHAAQEAAKIEKMAFTSAVAQDAAKKTAYAATKAQEAALKAVKKRDVAAGARSALDAQLEVTQVLNAEKRAVVEEKIAVEEAKIAVEAA